MHSLRLAFTDFPGPFNPQRIVALLSRRWEIEIVTERPDFVIYSVFGHEFMKHGGAVRVFFATENVRPDFNLCDYAFSCDWLQFGDRHFRAPLFVLYDQWRDIVARGASRLPDLSGKSAFCNFIYANREGHPRRDRFFHALDAVEPVESFGAHLRNSARDIGKPYAGDWTIPKVAAQAAFKFTIAFENSATPGYATEKIVHALCADTIPIYWGDPLIGRVFNEGRFINVNGITDEEAIEHVLALHRDEARYLDMVNRPFFSDPAAVAALSEHALLDAFGAIFAREKPAAFRRNFHFWGRKYEERRRLEVRGAKLLDHLRRFRE